MRDDVTEALECLSNEERDALKSLIANDRQALRECLIKEGYIDPTTISQEASTEPTADLTEAQTMLYDVVTQMGQPRTAEEVISFIRSTSPEFEKTYSSVKHRPWISKQLNTLVERGLIGRYSKGRRVKYTPTVEEAIRRWALRESRFVEELDQSDVRTIANETDMPKSAVRQAFLRLLD